MTTATQTPAAAPPKRQLRNFLLDSRFQLKFTGYVVAVALAVAALLGAFLWTTARALAREAEAAVDARSRAAQVSRELSNTTLSAEVVKHLEDPSFEERLKKQTQEIDARYESERAQVVAQRAELARRQQALWLGLAASLLAFVIFLAGAAIVATHRIVGPLYRIKRMANDVADGRLELPRHSLRERDELRDVFQAISRMIVELRARRLEEVGLVDELIRKAARGDVSTGELEALKAKLEAPLR